MSQRVASSAVYSTAGMAVQGLSRLAYTIIIGRVLGTEALGHAGALLSLSIFVALFWPTAAGNTSSRFLAVALHRGSSDAAVNRFLGVTTLASSVLLGAISVPIALALGNGPVTAASAALLVVGYGLYAYARGAQLGYHRAGRIAFWDTASSVLSLGLLVAVAVGGLSGLVLLPLAIGYVVFALACRPRGNGLPGADGLPEGLVSFAAWNVLAGLTTNGLLQIAMLAAQVYGRDAEAGVFAAAFTLATPASMLGQAVSQIVVPAFAHRSGGGGLRDRSSAFFVTAFAAVSAVAFGLVALVSPWALPIFYPAQGAAAVPMLQFLMLGVFVFTVALIPAALLLAAGRSRAVALASIGGFVVGIVTVVATGPSLGVWAGSVGFLVGSTVNLVAVVVIGLGRVDQPIDDAAAQAASEQTTSY